MNHSSPQTRNTKTILANIFRLILALTFIFSGFVKCIDPWGTAIKLGEYFSSFGITWLDSWKMGLAIWLCAAELMMGCMLLFKVRLRLITLFCLCSMIFFTTLTFILAVWKPIDDCGCFGAVIRLSNWETFFKNLILLPMSIYIYWANKHKRFFPFTVTEGVLTVVFATMAGSLGLYCWRHLPIIDLLPYKKGVNIAAEIHNPTNGELHTMVVYRDRQSGQQRTFELSDTTWQDTSRWEYVDTIIDGDNYDVEPSLSDFAIFDAEGDITDEILSDSGTSYIIFALETSDLSPRCEERLVPLIERARQEEARVICVTSTLSPDGDPFDVAIGDNRVRCYNMDTTTIKTIIRAKVGVMTLRGGIIVDKRACRDVR